MDDAATLAFREAQLDRRIRGAFRLLGALASVTIAFVLSLAQLQAWHEQLDVVALAPIVTFSLLGELVVWWVRRTRSPRIPPARLVQ